VKIKRIDNPQHPAHGQFGLFAARKLPPKTHVLDYLGYVHQADESDETSNYDIVLDKTSGIAIDAQRQGCEARMVNDYRGITSRPNVKFDDHYVNGELRVGIFSMNEAISAGTELCVNYGKGFWNARCQK
jgi:SET domain-containing protein